MDSRSQQPMINLSSSGIRQQGSGNALDLFLQRRAESIKRSRTTGTSSEFDKNSRAIRRARLSNFDQNPSPGSVLDSTVTNVMPSANAATGWIQVILFFK
ncbi:hypothetical protein DCAR_0205266 [Daucus carota subsp. sativus]|uniref:Uncharacterized protein n=1 Tax=Daucus carota subsp. sativus TaxID=79200 RepID=A0AAF1AK17_DAUCS|nr:hypothetical protein DCAR_0205266 [Daucus carota subsp. sativus]